METDTKPGAATRRSLLALGVAGGVALAAGEGHAAVSPLEFSTPQARLRAYMLMRGALDDRLVIGFVKGRYYGVIDEAITPLYGVVGATFARYRRRADGGYDGASYEIPFFTDLKTGIALDRFLNPYTGEEVTAPTLGFPPSAIVIAPDLTISGAKSLPGLVMESGVISSQVSGSDVWLTEQTTTAFKDAAAAKAIHYNEIVTLHASADDLVAKGAVQARCQTSYTSVVSWRPWLKMGDRPGHLLGNAVGRYGAPLEELPENWRAAAQIHRPDVLQNPSGPLDPIFAAFAPG